MKSNNCAIVTQITMYHYLILYSIPTNEFGINWSNIKKNPAVEPNPIPQKPSRLLIMSKFIPNAAVFSILISLYSVE